MSHSGRSSVHVHSSASQHGRIVTENPALFDLLREKSEDTKLNIDSQTDKTSGHRQADDSEDEEGQRTVRVQSNRSITTPQRDVPYSQKQLKNQNYPRPTRGETSPQDSARSGNRALSRDATPRQSSSSVYAVANPDILEAQGITPSSREQNVKFTPRTERSVVPHDSASDNNVTVKESARDSARSLRDSLENPRDSFANPRESLETPRDSLENPRDSLEDPRDSLENQGVHQEPRRESFKGRKDSLESREGTRVSKGDRKSRQDSTVSFQQKENIINREEEFNSRRGSKQHLEGRVPTPHPSSPRKISPSRSVKQEFDTHSEDKTPVNSDNETPLPSEEKQNRNRSPSPETPTPAQQRTPTPRERHRPPSLGSRKQSRHHSRGSRKPQTPSTAGSRRPPSSPVPLSRAHTGKSLPTVKRVYVDSPTFTREEENEFRTVESRLEENRDEIIEKTLSELEDRDHRKRSKMTDTRQTQDRQNHPEKPRFTRSDDEYNGRKERDQNNYRDSRPPQDQGRGYGRDRDPPQRGRDSDPPARGRDDRYDDRDDRYEDRDTRERYEDRNKHDRYEDRNRDRHDDRNSHNRYEDRNSRDRDVDKNNANRYEDKNGRFEDKYDRDRFEDRNDRGGRFDNRGQGRPPYDDRNEDRNDRNRYNDRHNDNRQDDRREPERYDNRNPRDSYKRDQYDDRNDRRGYNDSQYRNRQDDQRDRERYDDRNRFDDRERYDDRNDRDRYNDRERFQESRNTRDTRDRYDRQEDDRNDYGRNDRMSEDDYRDQRTNYYQNGYGEDEDDHLIKQERDYQESLRQRLADEATRDKERVIPKLPLQEEEDAWNNPPRLPTPDKNPYEYFDDEAARMEIVNPPPVRYNYVENNKMDYGKIPGKSYSFLQERKKEEEVKLESAFVSPKLPKKNKGGKRNDLRRRRSNDDLQTPQDDYLQSENASEAEVLWAKRSAVLSKKKDSRSSTGLKSKTASGTSLKKNRGLQKYPSEPGLRQQTYSNYQSPQMYGTPTRNNYLEPMEHRAPPPIQSQYADNPALQHPQYKRPLDLKPVTQEIMTEDGQRISVDINLKLVSPPPGQKSPRQIQAEVSAGPPQYAIEGGPRPVGAQYNYQPYVDQQQNQYNDYYQQPPQLPPQLPPPEEYAFDYGQKENRPPPQQEYEPQLSPRHAHGHPVRPMEVEAPPPPQGRYTTYQQQQPPPQEYPEEVAGSPPYRKVPPINVPTFIDDDGPIRVEMDGYASLHRKLKYKEKQGAGYQTYTLRDFKILQREMAAAKGAALGPDLDSLTYKEKLEKRNKQFEYARLVMEKNRQELMEKRHPTKRIEKPEPTLEYQRRKAAIDYARNVPKPIIKARPTQYNSYELSSQMSPLSKSGTTSPRKSPKQMEVINLQKLQQRHEDEKKSVKNISQKMDPVPQKA